VRARVVGEGCERWPYLADMRERVAAERADEEDLNLPIKTGRGGSMDLDFLAGGALFERGASALPALPSTSAMLSATVRGPALEALLGDYHTLRVVEARNRWVHARASEGLPTSGEALSVIAELVESGSGGAQLLARVGEVRRHVRETFDRVIAAGAISAA
jgi:glutamine synthetase adenylyltransferase